jgi:3-phenylpropionate/cinnamic acid dioxygenase small subunit
MDYSVNNRQDVSLRQHIHSAHIPGGHTMNDRIDISDVLIRYMTALDTRDWDLLHTCFTEDAVLDFGTLARRRDGWTDILGAAGIVTGYDRTQHMLSNIVITIDADEAQASSYFHAVHVIDGEALTIGGVYRDRLVRTPAGWRIAHRSLDPVWQSGDSELATTAHARAGHSS